MTEEPQDLSNIRERIKDFERLQENPAWRMILSAIQGQVDGLQRDILFGQITGPGDEYMMERKRGALEGRLSLEATALGILESLTMDAQQAQRNAEDE